MKNAFQNWSDVRVFLAVLRSGSTLAASRHLDMAQPTVARRIDALEQALRLKLFERDTRGFRPTADARRLQAFAEAVEAAADALFKEAEHVVQPNSRPIRITAPKPNFSANFAAILMDFRAENPGVHFEFLANDEVLDLAAGEADVAIRIAREIKDDRLICRKMTKVTGSLYASQGYAEACGLPGSEHEFKGHSFIVYDRYASTLGINEWLIDRIDPTQIVSRCSDTESMTTAIRAGLGIGPLTTSLAVGDASLLCCFAPPEGVGAFSWLLINPDAYRRPEVRAFSKFFAPRFQAIFRKP